MADTVENGRVVLLSYVLKGDDGEVLDKAHDPPMAYLHGHNNLVSGLEEVLTGKSVGDSFDVHVPVEKAYGERQEGWPQAVPRKEFNRKLNLRKGMPVRVKGSNGQQVLLYVTDVRGARVWVDVNHPLAGKNLHFSGTITGIRSATPEEHEHGHAHGPQGHNHR